MSRSMRKLQRAPKVRAIHLMRRMAKLDKSNVDVANDHGVAEPFLHIDSEEHLLSGGNGEYALVGFIAHIG